MPCQESGRGRNFNSHHPIEHKLSVVRTLVYRSQSLMTDNDDKEREDIHVQKALRACGYPEWSFSKVRHQMESARDKKVDYSGTRLNVLQL